MTKFLIPTLAATALLAACDSPTPPSYTAAEIAAIEARLEPILDLPEANEAQFFAGTGRYSGHIGGDITVDGNGGYGIFGDIALNVDLGDGDMDGLVDNLNLIDDGKPQQLLGGSLAVVGDFDGPDFTATATGTLSAVSEDVPFRGDTNVALNLAGTTLGDSDDVTYLAGEWVGGSTSVDDDFYVDGAGIFITVDTTTAASVP